MEGVANDSATDERTKMKNTLVVSGVKCPAKW